MEILIELRYEIAGLDDRSGDKLWEEAHIKSEIQNIPDRLYLLSIYVYSVADDLESEE